LFSPFGEIDDAIVITNKYTGRSRGFGFVSFVNDGDADKAVSEMDKKSVEGRELTVKEAMPMERSEENAGARNEFRGPRRNRR